MENVSEAAIRKGLGDKIAENLKKLNRDFMDVCKNTILKETELEDEKKFLNESVVLADFKSSFEAAQLRLQSSVTRKDLTDVKQQEISALKAQIALVKTEQNQINSEIDEMLESLKK